MECEQLEVAGLLLRHLHWLKVVLGSGDEPARVSDRLKGVQGVTRALSEEKEALHFIILPYGLQTLFVFYLLQKNKSIISLIIITSMCSLIFSAADILTECFVNFKLCNSFVQNLFLVSISMINQ